MQRYMLDTNIFNHLIDKKMSLDRLPKNGSFLITEVQRTEIDATPDTERRKKLLSSFDTFEADQVSNGFLWDSMTWGQMHWQNQETVDKVFAGLQLKRSPSEKKKKAYSDRKDAFIGEAAVQSNSTVLSNDRDFIEVMESIQPGSAIWVPLG